MTCERYEASVQMFKTKLPFLIKKNHRGMARARNWCTLSWVAHDAHQTTWKQKSQCSWLCWFECMTIKSWNRRIIEWLRLEGTLKILQFQPLPPTSSGCPEPHPTWPWAPPGMGHPHSSGQLCQCLTALWVEIFPLKWNLSLLSFSWKSFPQSYHVMLVEKATYCSLLFPF